MDFDKITEEINKNSLERIEISKPKERIPVDPNPRMLEAFYKKEVEWANGEINEVEKETNIKCTCKKGCNYCCYQPIGISTPELLAIKSYITNMNSENKKTLKLKVNDICDKITKSGIETNAFGRMSDSSEYKFFEEYFKLNIPCPMLNEDGLCSIYEIRPTNCWSYRAYGDSLDCKNSHSVNHSKKYDIYEQTIVRRLYEAKKPKKSDFKLLPFVIQDILNEKI